MKHVIIGGGAAGILAAEKIRTLQPDAQISIVMADRDIHSRCMLHKFLAGERDNVTMSFLPKEAEIAMHADIHGGAKVDSIDTANQVVHYTDDGGAKSIEYDRLLISTGSNGFVPPVGDLQTATNVHCFRHLSEVEEIKAQLAGAKRAVVIGAGLVGIDAAYGFLDLGLECTVIEMAPRIIPMQLDDEAAATYQKLFEEHGCKFKLGRKVMDTISDGNGRVTGIALDDGSVVNADIVVVAAGERAAVGFLDGSGIEYDRFIKVDEYMRTSAQNVFATGNVTGLSGTWPNAKKQAEVAAYNMCAGAKVYEDRYAFKNTMNFYGLITLSLGKGIVEEGDKVIVHHDSQGYRRAIMRGNVLDSIILQGKYMDYAGVYQYVIKNNIDLTDVLNGRDANIFRLTFADFYGMDERGQYQWQVG